MLRHWITQQTKIHWRYVVTTYLQAQRLRIVRKIPTESGKLPSKVKSTFQNIYPKSVKFLCRFHAVVVDIHALAEVIGD